MHIVLAYAKPLTFLNACTCIEHENDTITVAAILNDSGIKPTIVRIAISIRSTSCLQCIFFDILYFALICSVTNTPSPNARNGKRYFIPPTMLPVIKFWLIRTTLPVCAFENTLSLVK